MFLRWSEGEYFTLENYGSRKQHSLMEKRIRSMKDLYGLKYLRAISGVFAGPLFALEASFELWFRFWIAGLWWDHS